MKFYFAPMEGITLAPFRQVFQGCFPGIDKYFSPFLVANQTLHFQNREIRDILPENNQGIRLIPQILTNKPQEMLWAVEELQKYGYRELNLNLGCSMPQVAKRGRGAGFLEDKQKLDQFFREVFEGLEGQEVRVSVKTRIGYDSPKEARELTDIYNRYPIRELIIHPRTMRDLYGGTPDLEAFAQMYERSVHPVCYNGDIYSAEDYRRLLERYPGLERMMIGRGLLRNPGLVRELQGQEAAAAEELSRYHDALFRRYLEIMHDQRQAVAKMKALWTYWQFQFPGKEKLFKKLRKSVWPDQYEECVKQIMGLFTDFSYSQHRLTTGNS